jgi:enoyl-CoA hydratase/carnithine racemase
VNDSNDKVLFQEQSGPAGTLGIMTLNRPKALNALDHDMFLAMRDHFLTWQQDPNIRAIIIRGNGERAFCAGGDIRRVYEAKQNNDASIINLFADEYRLNYAISKCKKPYIALTHGITMGGGIGISLHGSHRIGAETLTLAMPETGIGLFPDIGGTYLYAQLPDALGTYAALTGARFNITDALSLNLIDYHIPFEQHDELITTLQQNEQSIDDILKSFHVTSTTPSSVETLKQVNHHFNHETVELIIESLQSASDDWSQKVLATLAKKSPLSLKISLQHLSLVREHDLAYCLKQDFRLISRFLAGHDFYEGIRALLIDKTQQPTWQHASVADVTQAEVDAYFAPLPDGDIQLGL